MYTVGSVMQMFGSKRREVKEKERRLIDFLLGRKLCRFEVVISNY